MGIYSKYIFPFLVEWTLGRSSIAELRRDLLSGVKGEVLEIGFGTGLNLSFYPESVQNIHVIDPNPGMKRKALKRSQKMIRQIDFHLLKGEILPFPPSSFDSVVSTFTLCSVDDVSKVLAEIWRVLKTGGRFFFLEHGLAPESSIQHWQKRFTPLNKWVGDGCHLDRDMEASIREAAFQLGPYRTFYFEEFPKIFGYFYQGVAVK